jgi:hypothetical protein
MPASRVVSLIVVISFLTFPVVAQQAPQNHSEQLLWLERGNFADLDLVAGSGGKDREPGTHFKFIKESTAGTSPKFDVEDENGTKWKVKLGEEVRSETAASRLVWAAGYFVDDDYYRPQIQVQGLKRLARGQQFVTGDIITNVRLERVRKGDDPKGWSWYDNSFSGTREFNGLKVMMALINMWDLKQVNNSSMDEQYRVADLGATFGNTGNGFTRSKGVMKDYAGTKFIDKVTPELCRLRHAQQAVLYNCRYEFQELSVSNAHADRCKAHPDCRRAVDWQHSRSIVHRSNSGCVPYRWFFARRG